MQECIICRKQKKKNEFNDAHVIPDAIGGYYHINKVCISCNSDIGNAIDVKLTNHFLTKFNRYQLGLKGKKGDLPNPFSGTHVLRDNPKQKIRYDLKEGGFTSYLIPNLEWQDDVLKITIDAKDKDKLPALIQKQTKRLTKEGKRLSHQSKMNEHETPHPPISIKSTIDINDFKLSLIKIAYEFTVDTIPEYYNDSQAIIISKAIKNKDFTYDNIQLLGDGFDRTLFTPFSHYFEFENLSPSKRCLYHLL